MIERRIKAAKFPAVKSLASFDFKAIPALNKMQVLERARCEWLERRENVIMPAACLRHDALGPSGTGKTHIALGLGLSACQKGLSVGFVTAAALVHDLMEARDERRLRRLQKQNALITSNLPCDEWTETFRSERLTGARLDRLTHHVNILEMNGDSYRLGQSKARQDKAWLEIHIMGIWPLRAKASGQPPAP